MQPFAYARPESLPEALALLGRHGSDAVVIGGGTDLVVGLRNGSIRPAVVIDLKRIAELRPEIRDRGDILSIGSTVVMATIAENKLVRMTFPALCDAAAVIGSIQIRNRATLAGNICHASPAADTPPALLVYGAVVTIANSGGSRSVSLDEFFVGPGTTVLKPGELVISIDLPRPAQLVGVTFARLTRRRGVDLATVNLCCGVDASGHTRLAYGAVGPRPFLVADESGVLADAAAGDTDKDEVLRRLLAASSPISDVRGSRDYREAMLLVMSRRALRTSIDRLAALRPS